MNGAIRVALPGDIEARTTNGDIRVEGSGEASARTTNGDIEALLSSQPTEDLSFRTVNGAIRV